MNKIQKAAQVLLQNREQDGLFNGFADADKPTDWQTSVDIQKQMIVLSGQEVAGWKCLLPPAEGKVVVGPIFADTVSEGEVCTLRADNGKARTEPEIAFILGQDIDPEKGEYSDDDVFAAIKECRMALELMEERLAPDLRGDFNYRLADVLMNQGLYLGPVVDKQTAFELAEVHIEFEQNGQVTQAEGKHPNGKASAPLRWFFNFAIEQGFTLKAGQAIITGSFAGIIEQDFAPSTIRYQDVGEYQVSFKQK
ncbi:hypothetical protein [Gayadomonas joobiniege]|uniref:hypothetical protein n=1 Tax=Gayadomonas joobiniege TaxID=1234606 RepID=UPI00036B7826|nr:hypothetical protein [Gayadomonas joobiniege]